ncbi:unnamed protein product, partial [Hapterophycus canaliculatus]
GATSNVFLAVHAATLKMVALKEVTVSSDADRRAVRTEMRALKTQRSPLLNSGFTTELAACPRIVDYYGSVVLANGNACIAVEYVAGGSLESWVETSCGGGSGGGGGVAEGPGAAWGVCPEPWFAHIAYQALEALDFVHSRGRVHRDVKPANLLITRSGDLKLGDFGAAGVEKSSRMIGTQRFMAPERLKGHKATAQSDLWSLALSLATAALGDDFISQASNQFEQLDVAGRVRRTLAKATTLSAEHTDFLHSCLSRDPARRPALRDLMKHPFLDERQDWQAKCPEVALAMRDRKRLQSGDVSAMSTEEVLDSLCRVRAEENLIGSSFDPATAADLAYELEVSAESLVSEVHRRTLDFIRDRGGGGGGGGGVSPSGVGPGDGENGNENAGKGRGIGGPDGGTDYGGGGADRDRRRAAVIGGGIASEAARRSRRSRPARKAAVRGGVEDGEETKEEPPRHEARREASRSLLPAQPPSPATGGAEVSMEVAPTASAAEDGGERDGDDQSDGRTVYPVMTPRNRSTGEGSTGSSGLSGKNSTSSSKRSRRRAVQMSSAVKLTPHKRRGERRASQTKRNGCYCAADGARRSKGRRERKRHVKAAAEPGPLSPRSSQDGSRVDEPAAALSGASTGVKSIQSTRRHHRPREGGASGAGACAGTAPIAGDPAAGKSGGGSAFSEEEVGQHTEACRRSFERESKRGSGCTSGTSSKPRTATSRTLPSRTDVRMRPIRGVFQLADQMKAQIAVRDRVHRLRVYPNCFSGREAVQWMLDGCHASSVIEAENIGNEMMKHSVFQHILNSHVFEDSSVYYQFTDGETPPPPSRGSRRLRQIARVFGGH